MLAQRLASQWSIVEDKINSAEMTMLAQRLASQWSIVEDKINSAEMTERSIVTDCKSVARLGYIGSNPILGTNTSREQDFHRI